MIQSRDSTLQPVNRETSSGTWWRCYTRELSILAALLVLLTLMAVVAPAFFRSEHLRDKLVANAYVLVAAVGMTLVILAKQIDISIGSQMSVCSVLLALCAQAGLPLPLVIAVAVSSGAAMGLINGWLVAVLRLPAIVVTLATMVVWRESLRLWREGEFVRGLQDRHQWFGLDQTSGQLTIVALAAGIWFAAWIWLSYLPGGRAVLAVGSNQEAARLMGIRPTRVLLTVFALMGMASGLAALLCAARFGDIDPNSGNGLELQVIAAVVIGGTSISGGRGSLVGTCLGVALLGLIGPALVFLHVQPQWERALQGLIILTAVASETATMVKRSRHVAAYAPGPGAQHV